jgi:hypothetical protein
VTGALPGPTPISGSVTVRRVDGRVVHTVTTDAHGAFTTTVPAGSYEITGQSPKDLWPTDSCHVGKIVHVTRSQVSTVEVLCYGQ